MKCLLLLLLLYCVVSSATAELKQSSLEKLKNVRYLGFTKENPTELVDIRGLDCSGNLTTVFIVHGYFTISLEKPHNLKDDFFKYNPDVGCVIIVSWLDYSIYSDTSGFKDRSNNYHTIAKNHLRHLEQDINEKLQYVHRKGAKKIELVGHGIGAHAAGVSARFFKLRTGYEINRIIGLDPAAPFFEQNPTLALKPSDAKNVTVFHTNTNRYGIGNEIGSTDIFVNGGETQPECKRKLTDNICSHNRGWEVYSEHLTNSFENSTINQTENKRLRSDRFVLCLDVSISMEDNSRLTRAITAGKKLLSEIKVGSYIGIVTFSYVAEISHHIIQIKDDEDRESLISKLPTKTIGATSIGAGLNLSMHMLLDLPQSDRYCSHIILLTDGEENTEPYLKEFLPDLQRECIGINSVAIGATASDDLESLSSTTKGNVIYAMENDDVQQITDTDRAFSFSYENEIDADIRSIYLPTRRVTLSNGENVFPFVIDKNIGRNTELTFTTNDIKSVDLKLISPNGQVYTSDSPEYHDDSSSMQQSYKIKSAEPGKWNLVVDRAIKAKRSIRSTFDAIITVKSQQCDDKLPPIRLDASVSHRTLEYPKSNKQSDLDKARILVFAELRRGRYPIIRAQVYGHIQGLEQETVTFRLRDDGVFPDGLANDGIYTAAITKLMKLERYSVVVTATNTNETAKLIPKEIDYFERELIDCDHIECEALSYFEREAYVGAVKLISTENEDRIPPNPITDLRATVHNETEKLIALEWTSPADEVFDVKVKQYDIRAIDGQEFENAFRFNDSHFVEKSFNSNDSAAERIEKYLLRVPDQIWKYDKKSNEPGFFLELAFAVKAIGMEDNTSPRSNLAFVVIKDRPLVLLHAHKICKKIRRKTAFGWISITYC